MGQISGLFSPFLRKKRIAAIAPYMRAPILDFGCETGIIAQYFSPDEYLGVDIDSNALAQASAAYPQHHFCTPETFLSQNRLYRSIVLLAVIEHIEDPAEILCTLRERLVSDGSIIITTPHPSWEWAHALGSYFGLFSKEAKAEHKSMHNLHTMRMLANKADLVITTYRRFLLSVNQLFVLKKSR